MMRRKGKKRERGWSRKEGGAYSSSSNYYFERGRELSRQ
jgi:hypothetical protein